jgi:hypothetical protein
VVVVSIDRLRISVYRGLVAVSLFQAVSAVGGGAGMVLADGLSMPKSLLADSPFSSFLLPGFILLVVVGGTQSIATLLLFTKRPSALVSSAVAGFGMLIWIIAEIAMIHSLTWAQLIYVVSGFLQLVFVLALLGVVSWLPRASTGAGGIVGAGRQAS